MAAIPKKKVNVSLPAGKGDSPRSCFSDEYGNNFDKIKWDEKKKNKGKRFFKKYN